MSNPRLKLNKYDVDPEEAHIRLRDDPDHDLFLVIQRMCPASLYLHDGQGYHYDYTGCLECGTCLIIGGDAVFAAWDFPRNGYGIVYCDSEGADMGQA